MKIIRKVFCACVCFGLLFSCSKEVKKIEGGASVEMVEVQGGQVPILPEYSPTVSSFEIAKFLVTEELYETVVNWAKENSAYEKDDADFVKMNSVPSEIAEKDLGKTNRKKLPVTNVTWYDAVYFCNLLTKKDLGESECVYRIRNIKRANEKFYITDADVSVQKDKKGYRLPTEVEWEYAARGGHNISEYRFSGSNSINDVAWCISSVRKIPAEVGLKEPNSLGVYDMSGNVWEWCVDYYVTQYNPYALNNPQRIDRPAMEQGRSVRGGSFKSIASCCTVSYRNGFSPYSNLNLVGFRVVRKL